MIPLAFLCATLAATVIALVINSRREREMHDRAIALVITEGTKEREAARLERQELANRIQAPEATPIYDVGDEVQSITYDSDNEYWETKETAE